MENKVEKAYKEILKVLKKHKDICVFDVDRLEEKAKNHLFGVELKEKYGFNIDPKIINNMGYQKLKEAIHVGFWDGVRSKISWSDDGSQPKGETLLYISYPTGAYIFGEDYPTELFQRFFLELKIYNPKYTDSANHSLYFSMDNAGEIYNKYDSILRKYNDINNEDFKKRKIIKMEEELTKLKSK